MTDPYPPGNRREEPTPAPDQTRPNTPELPQTAGLASDGPSGQTSGRYSVPPDPGCYEIRFRLTGLGALFVIFGLVLIAVGVFRTQPSLYERVSYAATGGLVALREIIPIVRRKILFRADPAGITLGAPAWFGFSHPTEFLPWTDINKIALYKITRPSKKFGRPGSYMIIVPRGSAYGRARRIDTWRLDTEHVAAVAAAAAPDVPVDDAGDVDPWVNADIKRLRAVFEQQPE